MKTLRTITIPSTDAEYQVVGIGMRRMLDRHGINNSDVMLTAEFAQVKNDREIPGTRQGISVPYELVKNRTVTVSGKDVTLAQWAAIGLEIAAAMEARIITEPAKDA